MSNAARRRAKREKELRAPLNQLLEVVVAIGDRFGTTASCVEAACVLKHAGRIMGYELTLRPVSVLAHDAKTESTGFMGEKATALLSLEDRARAIDYRPAGQGDTGHIVVTCEDPLLLFDPNLRQLGSFGIEAPSMVMHIASVNPETEGWLFRDGKGLEVHYMLDESSRGLLSNYDEISPAWEQEAVDLVRLIRSGGTADMIARGMARL